MDGVIRSEKKFTRECDIVETADESDEGKRSADPEGDAGHTQKWLNDRYL